MNTGSLVVVDPDVTIGPEVAPVVTLLDAQVPEEMV